MTMVSVVIPSFNCAQYIIEAIESVLKQTYNNFEIIIIDDGSTDNTKKILESYIRQGVIRYFYQNNKGPGAARNIGIKIAQGEYIAFLDADDCLTENSIEKRIKLIKCDPSIGLVFSGGYYRPEKSQIVIMDLNKIIKKYFLYLIKTPNGYIVNGLFKDIFEIPFLIHICSVMCRKSVFEKVGFFREDIFIAEDKDMCLRIAKNYKIGFINEQLFTYNQYRGNLTRLDQEKYCINRINFLDNLMKVYKKEKKFYKFLKKRKSIPYYDLANYFYKKNLKILAIKNNLKSIYYNHWDFSPFWLLLLNLIPKKVRKIIKRIF